MYKSEELWQRLSVPKNKEVMWWIIPETNKPDLLYVSMCNFSWMTPMSYTVQVRSARELKRKLNSNCKLGISRLVHSKPELFF